jgi:hypothetical protein
VRLRLGEAEGRLYDLWSFLGRKSDVTMLLCHTYDILTIKLPWAHWLLVLLLMLMLSSRA